MKLAMSAARRKSVTQRSKSAEQPGWEVQSGDSMATTKLLLATGDQVEVDATVDEVVKALEDAARSSPGTLARRRQSDSGEPLAGNATQVVTVRAGHG